MDSLHIPIRSISLPSRLHPNCLKIEAELTKLRSCSSIATGLLAFETIKMSLTSLAELFLCFQELTHSPQTQAAFHLDHRLNQVEDVLDASVGLIDLCSTARDMFLTMQEHIKDLQSALRRRGKDFLSIEANVQAYINFRKRGKKDAARILGKLKKLEYNALSFPMSNEEYHLSYVNKVIREVQAITVTIFCSLMVFLSLPVARTITGGCSLISKLIRAGSLASDRGQKIFNEVGRVDIALCSIHGQIKKSSDGKFDVQEVQERLETLAVSIHDLEAKLDCVFRCLIQNRVSLLNLVTP